ncbi:MAG: hypothetical protein ACI8S7_002133 [Candidatus Krumholzibacteriia bacterium]
MNDGRMVWRLRVASVGALSLNLGFTKFILPSSAQLLIYPAQEMGAAREFELGAGAEHTELWTPVFLTDDLVVELTVLAEERAAVGLELSQIGRGYRLFGEPHLDKAGSCNIDVICSDGDLWRDEIDSVGLLQRNGSDVCTGFMVNNVDSDGRSLFMTAFHCNVRAATAPSVVVYWNFQSPVCGQQQSIDDVPMQSTMGSAVLSEYMPSDFTLLELDEAPDPSYDVKYAGWNRSSADPNGAVTIHHPSTDWKSISFEDDPLTTTSSGSTGPSPGDGTHLRVTDWDRGTTEPGSSGGPLFDLNHRVVGQLHGGTAACFNNESDWYGRFSVSWTGGGTTFSRLSDHLDPDGSGVMTTDLFDPFAGTIAITPEDGGAAEGVAGGPFTPTDYVYTIENTGDIGVEYEVRVSASWLTVDTTGGDLGLGQSVFVTASINDEANNLPTGVHRAVIDLVNLSSGQGSASREIVLTVFAKGIVLVGPVPNPFSRPPVAIRYTLSGAASVRARISNIRGLQVRDLGKSSGSVGENDILWDGLDDSGDRVPSGVYVVTVEGLGQTLRKNLTYVH